MIQNIRKKSGWVCKGLVGILTLSTTYFGFNNYTNKKTVELQKNEIESQKNEIEWFEFQYNNIVDLQKSISSQLETITIQQDHLATKYKKIDDKERKIYENYQKSEKYIHMNKAVLSLTLGMYIKTKETLERVVKLESQSSIEELSKEVSIMLSGWDKYKQFVKLVKLCYEFNLNEQNSSNLYTPSNNQRL